MYNRGYIFTLFTKSQFTPTQVPLQVDSATIPDLILFFFLGVPKHPCFLQHYLQWLCLAHLNNGTRFIQLIFTWGVPFYMFYFTGSANLGYSIQWIYTSNIKHCLYILVVSFICLTVFCLCFEHRNSFRLRRQSWCTILNLFVCIVWDRVFQRVVEKGGFKLGLLRW